MLDEVTPQTTQPRLSFHLPLDPARLLRARHRIADYLYEHAVGRSVVGDVVLAVEEAMTNAVRHSGSQAPIEVRLGFDGVDLHAEVRDEGRGFDVRRFDRERVPDPLQPGGRGLYLITHLMDDVDLHADGGVRVRMTRRAALTGDPPRRLSLSAVPSGTELEHGASYREVRERSLVEEIPEGFAALDWEYCFTYANDLALETYHLQRDEVLGRCIWDLFPQIKEASLGLAIRESMELGSPAILDWDSTYLGRTLEFRIYPTSSGVSFYLRDIDERRRRERERDEYLQALVRSEQRFRALFENMIEGVAIHRLVMEAGRPVDYTVEDVNPSFETHLGLTAAEVLGGSARELSGLPEPPLLHEYARVVETGEPFSTDAYFEALDRHLRVRALSLGGDRFAAVFEDITEHKRIDTEREDLLRRLQRELSFTRLLARAAETATSALTIEQVAEWTLASIKDDLGDLRAGSIYLLDRQRAVLRHLALFGYPDGLAQHIGELPLDDGSNIGRVALTGIPLTHESPDEPPASRQRRREMGLEHVRWMALPIERAGEMLGVMALFFDEERPFGADEVRLQQGVAAILANTLKSARLLEDERAARRTARDELETTRSLLAAADALAVWTDLDELLRGLAATLLDTTSHTRSVISLWDGERRELRIAASAGVSPLEPRSFSYTDLSSPLRAVLLSGVVSVTDYDSITADERGTAEKYDSHLALFAPLRYRGRIIGFLGLDDPGERREFSDREIELVEGIAAHAAVAVENARLFEAQREVAATLQENLLHPLPEVPGVEVAVVSLPASQPELVGGDFHDVFVLPDGIVVAFIGDVMGKGIQAAGLTETVRSAVRALALTSPSPAAILTQVNRLLLLDDREQFVSGQLVMLDPGTGKTFAASAGHPPAVLFGRPDPEPVELPHGQLLGTFEASYSAAPLHLAPGEGLLLYTDGVTEARGPARRLFGEERLLSVVAGASRSAPAALVDHVRREVEAWAGRLEDDLQILALRRTVPSR